MCWAVVTLAADGPSANPNVFDAAFFETFYGARPANDWQLTMFSW